MNIESQAGNAAVTLRLDLGQAVHQPNHSHGLTNARDRHRQRRAECRKSAAEEAQRETSESQSVAEEVTSKTRTVGKDCNTEDAEKIEKPCSKVTEKDPKADTPVKVASVEETDDNDKKVAIDCGVFIFRYWDNFQVSEAQ